MKVLYNFSIIEEQEYVNSLLQRKPILISYRLPKLSGHTAFSLNTLKRSEMIRKLSKHELIGPQLCVFVTQCDQIWKNLLGKGITKMHQLGRNLILFLTNLNYLF
jgi:hypothetical protein